MDPLVIYKRANTIFFVCVVRFFVDYEVELDRIHLGDHCFIGAIEGFRFAEL